jgi:hypothetical protein
MIKRKNKLIMFMAIVVSMILGVATTFAANPVTYAADASPAFYVVNNSTGTLTIVVSGAGGASSIMTNAVTYGGVTTTIITTNGTSTIGGLETAIAACTNTAGAAKLAINSEPSLAADTVAILAGTYTALTTKSVALLWDTSAHLAYDVYLPSTAYGGVGAYNISRIVGQPTGTGNLTTSIYKGGTLIYQKVDTSPVYVNPATWLEGGTDTVTNTFGVINVVNLDESIGLTVLGGQGVFIRSARSTTATTGFLSVICEDASKISR